MEVRKFSIYLERDDAEKVYRVKMIIYKKSGEEGFYVASKQIKDANKGIEDLESQGYEPIELLEK